ncbi:MAG: hypothetical protein LCH56_14225 [Proteobacteria bacterium]|nr:hypothetical protein [Pseudomonadota bacterium]
MTTVKIVLGLAVLGLCIGLWARGEHYAARTRTSEALLKSAIAIGNVNAELARAQVDQARTIDAAAAVNALKKRTLRVDSDIRRKAIFDASVDTDGPLAPVLRDQLDRLPKPPSTDTSGNAAAARDPVLTPAGQ